jgi:predicted ATPase
MVVVSRNNAGTVEDGLGAVKARIREIAAGGTTAQNVRDKRFTTHLASLRPENLDRLDCWFPEDSLQVRYSTTSDGNNFRSIQEGSPGQKTAALLAFLLSYGTEPIILDQPEDDLDNHLIYGLIVTQLKTIKRERQVIVVTHNANIVVNGDAEYVAALDVRGGQTRVVSDGGLQEEGVRTTICNIMEGGEQAFEARYRRIRGGRRAEG